MWLWRESEKIKLSVIGFDQLIEWVIEFWKQFWELDHGWEEFDIETLKFSWVVEKINEKLSDFFSLISSKFKFEFFVREEEEPVWELGEVHETS